MDKIYQQAKDKNVAATIVYTHGGPDGKAYKDAEGKEQFTTSELREAFLKGCLINWGIGEYYTPTGIIDIDEGIAAIEFTKFRDVEGKGTLTAFLYQLAAIAD